MNRPLTARSVLTHARIAAAALLGAIGRGALGETVTNTGFTAINGNVALSPGLDTSTTINRPKPMH